jgi:hypothetical protein
VAIKVLPEAVANDPDRLERFQRRVKDNWVAQSVVYRVASAGYFEANRACGSSAGGRSTFAMPGTEAQAIINIDGAPRSSQPRSTAEG